MCGSVLRDGVTLDQLPPHLELQETTILVLVLGRPPVCLRCRHIGHIRKDCRVPRYNACRRFGDVAEDSVRAYATVSVAKEDNDMAEAMMNYQGAEAAAVNEDFSKMTSPEDVTVVSLSAAQPLSPADATTAIVSTPAEASFAVVEVSEVSERGCRAG